MIKRDIVIGVILLAIAAAVPFLWPERYVLLELTLFFIYATVVTQWNLVFGVAGVFSLAQMAIFAMGGYVTGMLGLYLNWSLWVAMPVGAVAAVIFSVIIGVACLRLGGAYVALLTFAIAEAMYLLIITDTECFFMEGVTCRNFTGGTRGLVNFGNFGFQQLLGYKYAAFGNYFLALALLALATAFSVFVIRSPVGMAFAALRDNTTYAIARGISRFKYQLLVFAASALFTGLAGAVYAGYFSVMGADMLNLTLLLLLLSMMVVGGLGRVWGPIAGAVTLTLVNEGLNEFVDWRLLGLGLILILFIIFWPAGIVGAIEAAFAWLGPKRIAPQPRRALGSRATLAPGRRAERKATVEAAAPEPVLRIDSILGEGPVWSEDEQALYWLDVFLPALNRFDPTVGINKATPLDRPIYAMALRTRGGAIGAFEDGIGFVDLDGGTIEIFGDPKAGSPVNFNDGKCDRRGRFWTGTMAKDWSSPIGGLYRVEPSQKITQMDGEIILSNGLGWSPDDRTMYFTDFGRRVIYAYDFDADTGTVSKRRPFIEIPQDAGFPDGMTVDAEGCLWVAHWDGWRITRYWPDGKPRQTIRMPVKRPTSCTFGGPDFSVLYVTSARMGLTEGELAAAPLSGSIFAIRTDTVGRAEPKFPA